MEVEIDDSNNSIEQLSSQKTQGYGNPDNLREVVVVDVKKEAHNGNRGQDAMKHDEQVVPETAERRPRLNEDDHKGDKGRHSPSVGQGRLERQMKTVPSSCVQGVGSPADDVEQGLDNSDASKQPVVKVEAIEADLEGPDQRIVSESEQGCKGSS